MVKEGARILLTVLTVIVGLAVGWFAAFTYVAGHAFPVLGVVAILIYAAVFGWIWGFAFNIGRAVGVVFVSVLVSQLCFNLQLTSDRAEKLGYWNAFWSELGINVSVVALICLATLAAAAFGHFLRVANHGE